MVWIVVDNMNAINERHTAKSDLITYFNKDFWGNWYNHSWSSALSVGPI